MLQIKQSTLNILDRTLPMWFDEYGMALTQARDKGKGDCIGRTFLARFTYDNPYIGNGIGWCYSPKEKDPYPLYRHPSYKILPNTLSRDHLFYYFLFQHEFLSQDLTTTVKQIKRLKWRFSEFKHGKFTIDLWLYIRILHYIHSAEWYEFLYYLIQVPFMTAYLGWSQLMKAIFYHKRWNQDNYDTLLQLGKIPKQNKVQKWVGRNLMLPVYALHIFAWQLWSLPDHWSKRWLQKQVLKFNEKSNYVIRLLCDDDTVTKKEVLNYKASGSYRWGTTYDIRNDRDIRIIRDPKQLKYNVLDEDLLYKLWNLKEQSKK
jgi:hypothetical protein